MIVIAALILGAMGTCATGFNIYLAFARYPWHQLRHRGEPYKYVSGVPLYGSLFLWIAAALCRWCHQQHLAFGLLLLSLFDTGGLHWFLISQMYASRRD